MPALLKDIPLSLARAAFQATKQVAGSRLADTLPAALVSDLLKHTLKRQTGVSLRYILNFGTQPLERQMLLSGRFLHSELPVRLAHRVLELENLPYGLSNQPQILTVRDWYIESFNELRKFKPVMDAQDEIQFTYLLKKIYKRHANVVPVIAKGIEDFKRTLAFMADLDDLQEVHQFLDRFFLSRIGIRFLIGHHVALHEHVAADHVGLINTRCSPLQVAQDAASDARQMCLREYTDAPEVLVRGNPELQFAYVPSHLHHMVFELVKNSLRASQERFDKGDRDPPPVSVVIAEGGEDITIKVADEGGGIPRSGLQKIWTYLYTTARSPLPDVKDADVSSLPAVLAGYGCGLPISRLYAKYFGGDMQLISMEGYGTDAYLHLNRLGNGEEPLP